ncbi:MAG TPA: hypothetical protein VM620_13840 [Hyphomicrobium sp.]|jgi:hypothetical protein|nr:hypothetical protein [Hyphomicrobium sp.]
MPLKSFAKALLLVPAGVALLALSGCGYDGVQLNGKIFDVVGLNGDQGPAAEPKMKVRQPLVMPPSVASLPDPGSGKEGRPSLAEIQDPDREKKVSQADLEKQQEAYCKTHYEDAIARGDASADSASGPLGACHPSIFTGVKKWMASGKSNGDEDDDTTTQ